MRFVKLTDCPAVTGWALVRCPACRKEYRNHLYGFADLTAMRTWSDGFVRDGLYCSGPSVCKCACGALFLRAKALTNSGSWGDISCIVRRQTGTGERENGQILRCNAAWGG